MLPSREASPLLERTGLPDGVVTTLFTDIEGSTQLLRTLGTERYREQLELHRELLRHAFAFHRGHVVEMQGDSFRVAFPRPSDALAAAGELQRGLESTSFVLTHAAGFAEWAPKRRSR